LGISQFMQGRQADAQKNFQAAIRNDRNISIRSDEVLDDSVITSFNAARSGGANSRSAASGNTMARSANTTHLYIESNVKGATVMVDGILAGQTGNLLEVDHGRVSVDISAPGFKTKRIPVNIIKGQETRLGVTLDKIEAPKPKVVAALPSQRGGSASAGKAAKKPSGSSLFGDVPVDEPVPTRASMGNQGGGGSIYLPDAEAEKIRTAPATPQRDLVQELEMQKQGYQPVQAAPVYQQPAPNPYQQPYAQPYGYQQQPPVVVAPPPVYYPPQQPAYYPYQQPVYQQPVYSPPPPPAPEPVAAAPAAPAKASPAKPKKNMFLAIMPFGVGQFQNKSYILGSFFLLAEAGALGYGVMQYMAADKAVASTNATLKEMQAAEETLTGDQLAAATVDRENYAAEAQSYVSSLRTQGMIGAGAFGGLWIAGAIEAVLTDPPADKPKSKVKKSSKRNFRLSGTMEASSQAFAQEENTEDEEEFELDLTPIAPSRDFDIGMTWVSVPQSGTHNYHLQPAIAARLLWEF